MKALVNAGHPIGAIAHLPTEGLRGLLGSTAIISDVSNAELPRIALVGGSLAAQVAACSSLPAGIVGVCADCEGADTALQGVTANVLAVEVSALREDAADWVESIAARVGALRVVVAYRFGTQAAAAALRARGHVVVRAPLDLFAIPTLAFPASARIAQLPPAQVPAPRYDETALAGLSASATSMYCECPHHVVELLRSVSAFERYSAECINRSAADAELHRHLERAAAQARVLFEEALERVARAEGLTLPRAREDGNG